MFISWTSLILLETWIEIKEFRDHTLFTASEYAAAFTEKDILIRKWAASHGGVYVPVTDKTPPNPYLSFLPNRDLKACDKSGNCLQLTLMNPAYITRELYERFSPGTVIGHITSMKPVRPENGPDVWEKRAMKQFETGTDSVKEIIETNGKAWFHYMIPFITEKPCLKCHANQGYREGDIRGGLHITFEMDKIFNDFNVHRNHILTVQLLVWLAGLAMLALVYQAMKAACEQKEKAAKEIKQREHFLRNLINAIPDPVCYKDTEGRWLESNTKTLELFHLQGVDFYNKTGSELAELTHSALGEFLVKDEQSDRETIESGRINRFDKILPAPDGSSRIFDVIKVPIINNDGNKGILVVARDITSRKQLEAQLQQSQKMEAVGVLAGGVAHDLNNIIQTIMGAAGLATMKLESSHPAFRYVRQIDESCERAAAIISQLLIFSRRHDFTPEPLNINTVTSNLIKMLKRLIGEDISIQTDFAPDTVTVMADRGSMEQVVMNLVVNARDAMPEGGTITIKTSNHTATPDDMLKHPKVKEGNYCCLIISDTGTGISDEIITKIFDPFFTTKGVGKGTGLGLSTVYGIVTRHKGWIDVETRQGKGTTFKIYIPAATLDDLRAENYQPEEGDQEERIRGNGERILIVEDDEDIRRVVAEMLGSIGYSATAVATGEDALRLIDQGREQFDVMLVDMVLPGMKGLDLVRMISHRNDLPGVILNSGYTDERADISSLHNEYIKFIAKPYEFQELLKLIRDVLDEKK